MTNVAENLSILFASEVLIHNNIGVMLQRKGDFSESMEHYGESLRLRSVLLQACNCSGRVEYQVAAEYHDTAQCHLASLTEQYASLQMEGKVVDKSGEGQKVGLHFFADPQLVDTQVSPKKYELSLASTLFNMSLEHHRIGSLTAASKLLRMALDAIEDIDSFCQPVMMGIILNNMACIDFEEGRYESAMETFTEIYLLLQKNGDGETETIECDEDQRVRFLGKVIINMAWTCSKLGHYDDAKGLCGQIHDLYPEDSKHEQNLCAIQATFQQQEKNSLRASKTIDRHWLALYRDDEILRSTSSAGAANPPHGCTDLSQEEIKCIEKSSKSMNDTLGADGACFRSSFSSRKIIRTFRVA